MRHLSYLALAGGLILLLTTGLYLGLIARQEPGGDLWSALPWAAAMALAGSLAVFAALLPAGPRKRHLLTIAGAASLLLGLVAIFSVGMLLILAGVALLAAASAQPRNEKDAFRRH